MTGEWLIRQQDRDGRYTQERVTVGDNQATLDQWSEHVMRFVYQDGRIIIFPHANILRAEYRPHTQP